MLKKIIVLVLGMCAAIASAQFLQGAQGLGELIGKDGAKGRVAFAVMRGPTSDARVHGNSGFFDFHAGSPAGGRMVHIRLVRNQVLDVRGNEATFGGPAIMNITTNLAVIRYKGMLKVHVRDVVRPGSPLTILDEIGFTFESSTNAGKFVFDGWMQRGDIEVFGGWRPSGDSLN